jgi:ketosteroid isomerase-like protein
MTSKLRIACVLIATLWAASTVTGGDGEATVAELDAFWAEMSRTVEEGDFEGYGALYHPDAVLVSGFEDTSYPIAGALARWEQLFVDTRSGAAEAGVSFRFSRRLHNDTTAHETGVFNYRFRPAEGEGQDQYVHFQALLVKKNGRWLMVMEYQLSPATEEEWAALR